MTEPFVPHLPKRFSFSAAETYETCPKRWRAKYVQKVPDPPGPEAVVGTMVHDVLEVLARYPAIQRTIATARAIARHLWRERPATLTRLAWPHVIRALEEPSLTGGDVLFTERKIKVTVAGVPTVGAVDRGDLLDDRTVKITDYKTGVPSPPHFLDKKVRQVVLYASLVEATVGLPVTVGALHWTAEPRVDEFDISPDDIRATLRWFSSLWDELGHSVEHDDFPARPGPLCSWCPIVTACPEGRAMVLHRYDIGKRTGAAGMVVVDQRFSANLEASVAVSRAVASGESCTVDVDEFGQTHVVRSDG